MWRCTILACLAASVLLAASYAMPGDDQPAGPNVNGIWVTRISDSQSLKPCGDGEHVWAWDENHLFVVDRFAERNQVKDLPSGVDSIFPAGQVGDKKKWQAWVVAGSSRQLFLVDTDGVTVQCPLDHARVDSVQPSGAKGEIAWVTTSDPVGLYKVTRGPKIISCKLPLGASRFQVEPAGDRGDQAWLIGTGPAKFFSYVNELGASTSFDELADNTSLAKFPPSGGARYMWVVTGKGASSQLFRVRSGDHPVRYGAIEGIRTIFPVREPEGSAWALTEDNKPIYLVNPEFVHVQMPQPLFSAKVEPEDFHLKADASLAWAQTSELTGLWLFKPNKEPKRFIEDERIQQVSVSAGGKNVWAAAQGGQIHFVSAESEELHRSLAGVESLGVKSFIPASDDQHVWVLDTKSNLHLLDQKAKVRSFLMVEDVWKLLTGTEDKEHAWVAHESGASLSFLGMNEEKELTSQPLNSKGSVIDVVYAVDGTHGWIATEKGNYRYGYDNATDIQRVRLQIGKTVLDSTTGKADVRGNPREGELIEFVLKPDRDWLTSASERKAQIHVSVYEQDQPDPSAVAEIPRIPVKGKRNWAFGTSPQSNIPCRVRLTITDSLGSHIQITWPNVTFLKPWYEEPWLVTLAAYLGITAAAAVTLLLFRSVPSVSSWSPIVCWLLGGAVGWLPNLERWLYPGWLTGLLVATVLLCFVVGLFSARLFRLLGKMEPFSRAAPLALQFGFVRKRLFADYLAELESELDLRRTGTNNEVYVPIPARVSHDQGQGEPIAQPATPLCKYLTDADTSRRRNVFIESPGGRGKSALLRQVVQLAIDTFKKDPCSPLPVFCDLVRDQPIEEMVRRQLGRHVLTNETFLQQMLCGHFFAVLDGLSESSLPPERLRDFIVSEAGQATCMLMSTRPDAAFRSAVQGPGRVVLVEPQRLIDDQLLAAFEKTYLEQDAKEPNSIAARLSEDMKNACRSADGSYLPLLVRLAVRVGGGGDGSVEAVYERTFQMLLRRAGGDDQQLLEEAARLCVNTYWKDGIRPIAFQGTAPERQTVLRRLRDAGILVDHGVTKLLDQPRMVRFFHDSMQSYLTAIGIFRGYTAKEGETADSWRQLSRAAGDPVFKGQSDISSGVGAELFQMCMHVFIPPERLKIVFQNDLRDWAINYERGLSKDDILRACPEDLRQALELQLDPKVSAGVFLSKAVDLCSQDSAAREVRYLGILYGGIAPLVWQIAQRGTIEPQTPLQVAEVRKPTASAQT